MNGFVYIWRLAGFGNSCFLPPSPPGVPVTERHAQQRTVCGVDLEALQLPGAFWVLRAQAPGPCPVGSQWEVSWNFSPGGVHTVNAACILLRRGTRGSNYLSYPSADLLLAVFLWALCQCLSEVPQALLDSAWPAFSVGDGVNVGFMHTCRLVTSVEVSLFSLSECHVHW